MVDGHQCGPEFDPEFFDDVVALFRKHANLANKYGIKCNWHETNLLKVDLTKVVGISRIEGGRVVKEFVDPASVDPAILASGCCEYAIDPVTGKRTCQTYWA
jgi:hypothetical protein